jgi:hypothetical protein
MKAASEETARRDLVAAYNAESQALTRTRDRFQQFADSLGEFRKSLLLGNLSPLSPEARYAEAARQFDDIARRAQLGDADAIEQLRDVSQAFLDASRGYNASSERYSLDFGRVQEALASTAGVAERQAHLAGQQLDALREQVRAFGILNDSVLSVADAIRALETALAAAGSISGAMRLGGVVGAYQGGGIVGNGLWDMDSVLARYAGGGHIALAGGEHVTRAPAVNSNTLPVLNHINRTGRAPVADSSGVEARLDRVAGLLERLLGVSAKAGDGTIARLEKIAGAAEEQVARQRLNDARAA